jgi:hypothetical protein
VNISPEASSVIVSKLPFDPLTSKTIVPSLYNVVNPITSKLPDIIADPVNGNGDEDGAYEADVAVSAYELDNAYELDSAYEALVAVSEYEAEVAYEADVVVSAYEALVAVSAYDALVDVSAYEELVAVSEYEADVVVSA